MGSTNDIPPNSATVTEILQTLEMLGELEVFDVVITGGETLLFHDIFTVLERAKQVIPYVCLNSNGTDIVPWIAKRLATIGLDVVKISIDSPHPEVHDRFRGQSGAFKRSIQGVKRLVAEGVRVDTHTVISRESVNSIEDIDALLSLAKSLGVTKVHFGRLFATGRGANEQKLDFEHLTTINEYLDSLKGSNPLIGRTPGKTRPHIPQMPWYDGCGGCGRSIYAYIAYNREVYPCTNLYKPERPEVCMGDLREQPFATIWQQSPNYQRLQTLYLPPFTLRVLELASGSYSLREIAQRLHKEAAETGKYTRMEVEKIEAAVADVLRFLISYEIVAWIDDEQSREKRVTEFLHQSVVKTV